jgi:hypothetical protein
VEFRLLSRSGYSAFRLARFNLCIPSGLSPSSISASVRRVVVIAEHTRCALAILRGRFVCSGASKLTLLLVAIVMTTPNRRNHRHSGTLQPLPGQIWLADNGPCVSLDVAMHLSSNTTPTHRALRS